MKTRSSGSRWSRCRVVSEKKSRWVWPFVIPWSREAVFVVSPIAVYSRRRSEPTLPETTMPVFRPMPILKPSLTSCSRSHAFHLGSRSREHLARGRERAVGVVGLLDRRAEHGHDPVALVGDERAAVVEDRLGHLLEVARSGTRSPAPAEATRRTS